MGAELRAGQRGLVPREGEVATSGTKPVREQGKGKPGKWTEIHGGVCLSPPGGPAL